MTKLLKNSLLVLLLVASATLPKPADAAYVFETKLGEKTAKVKFYGLGQFEARSGDAYDGIQFSAQRVRLGTNYYYDGMFAKLQLDFNQDYDKSAGLSKVIKDAFVGYRFSNAAFIRLGMIKTPVGMAFTTAGWNLDITERNKLDKGLVLERDMGILLSGRFIGFAGEDKNTDGTEAGHEKNGYGIGYDIGVFNPADRSSSVTNGTSVTGDANAFAGRLHFDYGTPLHFEIAYGVSQEAAGEGTEDYKVFSMGIDSLITPRLNIKADYTRGENILGVAGDNQATTTLMVAYMTSPAYELVLKHYYSKSEKTGGVKSDLGNTYLGVNFYLTDLGKTMDDFTRSDRRNIQSNRIQFNYVVSSGDGEDWTGHWGYTDDAFILQWQYKF